MKSLLSCRKNLAALLIAAALLGACDTTPAPPTATAIPAQATPETAPQQTPVDAGATAQPVSQGWILKLSNLKQENDYRVALDVMSPRGGMIGIFSMLRGRSYEQQGKPDLISSVQLRMNGDPMLELAAANTPANYTDTGHLQVAKEGQSYESTTAEGWHVRTSVKGLSVDEHPKLPNGTTGPEPVFTALDLDVEITGSAGAPYLGFVADNVVRDRAALENLRGPGHELLDHGVVIRQVAPDSPASKAGLRQDDVVLAINDQKIDEENSLSVLLNRFKVGDTVKLDIVRDEKLLKVDVVLEKRMQ